MFFILVVPGRLLPGIFLSGGAYITIVNDRKGMAGVMRDWEAGRRGVSVRRTL